MITCTDLTKHFGKRTVFSNVTFMIRPDDRIGLVGANGTGKTTLFRVLAGEMEPDDGVIQRQRGVRIGFLPQEIRVHQRGILLPEVVRSVFDVEKAERERHEITEALKIASPEEAERLARHLAALDDRFAHAGGYEIETRAKEVLGGLGFDERDFARNIDELSGGWHMRIELAKLLLSDLDVLLLDEPTNHLDLETIQWFESWLKQYKGAYVMVAHDREFLNRTIERILEVTPTGLREYPGSYDTYRKRRAEDDLLLEKRAAEQQARIREIEDFIARNRVRKDRAAQVQSRIKMLEKIERIELPRHSKGIHFKFPPAARSGETVLELKRATKRYGDHTVLRQLDLGILREERVALVGLNGAGKSTLLTILAGVNDLTEGERVLGHNVSLQYFAQHQLEALTLTNTVQKEVESAATWDTHPIVRGLLGAFLFSGDDVEKPVGVLSGGEKSRVALAKMLVRSSNLLILDEPTNHLDIDSREVLEQALLSFGGTVVFTSHDRQFIDHVATKVIEVRAGDLHHYLGNYTYYAWKKAHLEEDRPEQRRAAPSRGKDAGQEPTRAERADDARAREGDKDRKRREAEARNALHRKLKPLKDELDEVENAITLFEIRQDTVDRDLADPDVYKDAERVRQLNAERAEIQRDLARAMSRWEQLGAEIEAIEKA